MLRTVLLDILDTPVSPELLPAEDGKIAQQTEKLVGPYELHDFYLYYVLRFGFGPAKIFRLAKAAFAGRSDTRKCCCKWLRNFYRRFFAQQFKRSCLPDGPKVGTVTLSPRGDWRMPSDACAALWLAELEQLQIKDLTHEKQKAADQSSVCRGHSGHCRCAAGWYACGHAAAPDCGPS